MRSIALLLVLLCAPVSLRAQQAPRLDVRMVTDEAEAVLHILDGLRHGTAPDSADWHRLFASEGYVRLKARQAAMGRAFDDADFQAFVLSDTLLLRREALRATLQTWVAVDPGAAARRAFGYLPQGTTIRARVYPSIKPHENSFVFEPRENPAIFLFLNPEVSAAELENTLAHELHHIGFAGACAEPDSTLPRGLRDAMDWMGGFGEGIAMLAAADGPDIDPHATSGAEERAVWQRDLANAPEDMRRMEAFFTDLMNGRLDEEEAYRRGFEFVVSEGVPQGAFYTVGWLMASTVERELGRARLVVGLCDGRRLLMDYDEAARRAAERGAAPLPLWSSAFLQRIAAGGDGGADGTDGSIR